MQQQHQGLGRCARLRLSGFEQMHLQARRELKGSRLNTLWQWQIGKDVHK
jgi:hypothetical protein